MRTKKGPNPVNMNVRPIQEEWIYKSGLIYIRQKNDPYLVNMKVRPYSEELI